MTTDDDNCYLLDRWNFEAYPPRVGIMASPSGPAPSTPLSDIGNECWNERTEIRTEILRRLRVALRERLGRERVPPAFWAFCQVADVSKLERMLAIAQSAQDLEIAELLLEPTIKDCDSVISRCKFPT